MDFGLKAGYGVEILRDLHDKGYGIPVLIHSSSDDVSLREKCSELGAKEWIGKVPCAEKMQKYLNQYIGGEKNEYN